MLKVDVQHPPCSSHYTIQNSQITIKGVATTIDHLLHFNRPRAHTKRVSFQTEASLELFGESKHLVLLSFYPRHVSNLSASRDI